MSKKLQPVSFFETEAEERHFWETHDAMDYVDWSKARRVPSPNLDLTLPEGLAQAAESRLPPIRLTGRRQSRRNSRRPRYGIGGAVDVILAGICHPAFVART